MVNRLWQQHFGRGIVATPNDFGRQGELPTHPQLLDYLALRFIQEGWSLKTMHRLMVTSAVYRQASQVKPSPQALKADPDNRLIWRMPIRRLEAEQIRDAMLAASGELEPVLGGEGVDGESPRPSIYVKMLRNRPDPFLVGFDLPDMFNSCGRRSITTTPLQSLEMINGGFSLTRAAAMGKRLSGSAANAADCVQAAYLAVLSRGPTAEEKAAAVRFLQNPSVSPQEAVEDLCHTLLTSNAFLYID